MYSHKLPLQQHHFCIIFIYLFFVVDLFMILKKFLKTNVYLNCKNLKIKITFHLTMSLLCELNFNY